MKKTTSVVLAACTIVASFALTPTAAEESESTDAQRSVSVVLEQKLGFGTRRSANCNYTALAARLAGENAAWDDFWLGIGNAFQDTGTPFLLSTAAYWTELQDALSENEDIFVERAALCQLAGNAPYDPSIDPNDFSSTITNQFMPFPVGRVLVYHQVTPEGLEVITVTVLSQTVDIEGVECRVVRDVVTLNGEVVEDTDDYFAQDNLGNVWYFGEVSKNYEDGFLDNLDGSWRHGKDSAKAGIIMHAAPTVGLTYREEFFLGEAEDAATILALGEIATVPAGTYTGCVKIDTFTPIEPGQNTHKWFAPTIGTILEVDQQSGEMAELISVTN